MQTKAHNPEDLIRGLTRDEIHSATLLLDLIDAFRAAGETIPQSVAETVLDLARDREILNDYLKTMIAAVCR